MSQTDQRDAVIQMKRGSHTHSVARLDIGASHTISRPVQPDTDSLAETISRHRRSLAHAATVTSGRVRRDMPERQFAVNTGVLCSSDNRLYVCAVIERIR